MGSRYLVRIAETCGMCTLGKVEMQQAASTNENSPSFAETVEVECENCKGTGMVDERWIDAKKLQELLAKEQS